MCNIYKSHSRDPGSVSCLIWTIMFKCILFSLFRCSLLCFLLLSCASCHQTHLKLIIFNFLQYLSSYISAVFCQSLMASVWLEVLACSCFRSVFCGLLLLFLCGVFSCFLSGFSVFFIINSMFAFGFALVSSYYKYAFFAFQNIYYKLFLNIFKLFFFYLCVRHF